MIYEPSYLRKRSKEIIRARNWGVAGILGILSVGLFISEIERIRALQFDVMQYAYLVVFVLTGILIFLWIWASQKELDLLFEWLDPERYIPPSTIKETGLILFFAVILVVMLFAARNPLIYGLVLTTYSVIQIPAVIFMNREIESAIIDSRQRVAKDLADRTLAPRAKLYVEGIDVLESYFLKRPVVPRLVAILVASMLGTAAAVYWNIGKSWLAGTVAYVLYATTIIVSEFVIGHWRCARDNSLRSILGGLAEHERQRAEQESASRRV